MLKILKSGFALFVISILLFSLGCGGGGGGTSGGGGNGGGGGGGTNPTPPGTPTNLVATREQQSLQTSQIRLTWDAPQGTVTGYIIQRKLETESDFKTLTTIGVATQYLDSTNALGELRYRIKALNTTLESGWSNVATVAESPPPPPPPPAF